MRVGLTVDLVMEPEFLKFITSDKTYLEREPLENIKKINCQL